MGELLIILFFTFVIAIVCLINNKNHKTRDYNQSTQDALENLNRIETYKFWSDFAKRKE